MANGAQIESIAKLADAREQKAASLLQQANLNCMQMQQNLAHLQSIRDDYSGKFRLAAEQGMTACRLSTFRDFLNKLERAIGDQEKRLAEAGKLYARRRQEWELSRQQQGGMEKLLQRQEQTRQAREAKAESGEMDDYSNRLFITNRVPA